jgi:hypothetical protein
MRVTWQRREHLFLERLESRELLAATPPFIVAVSPADGSTTTSGQPTLAVRFSEDIIASQAQNTANYLLFSSSGQSITINSAFYDSTAHQVTLVYNGGAPLTADQYSLFVRGDQIHDVAANLPLVQSAQLLVANTGAANVSVVTLPGNGTSQALTNYAITGTNAKPIAATVAQLRPSGLPDLIVVNASANNVQIFRGLAAGVFETTASTTLTLPTGADPQALVVANLAASGLPDIAVANLRTNNVTVFLNNGQGQFGAGTSFAAGNSPIGIVAGNFSGRGSLDLAVADSAPDPNNQYDVTILPADPGNKGSFLTGVAFDTGLTQLTGLAAGTDLRGNPSRLTTADLVVSAANGARVLVNATTSAGTPNLVQGALLTTTATTAVAVGQLTSVNRPDIVATTTTGGGQILVFQNASGGLFSSAIPFAANANPTSVALGDLDGDGKLDVIVGNNNNPVTDKIPGAVTVLLNRTQNAIAFAKPANYTVDANPSSVAVHVNSQTNVVDEVITANLTGNDASVLPGNGDGTLSASSDVSLSNPGSSIIVGDVNGDRLPDIIIGSTGSGMLSASTVTILLGQAGGTFAPPVTLNVGTSLPTPAPKPLVLALADLTGTGKQDILVANPSDGTITVVAFINGGFGALAPVALSTTTGMSFAPTGIAVGDFRHTGHADVAVSHVGAKSGITFLAGNGDRTFARPMELSGVTIGAAAGIAAADFNLDGNLDLAVADSKAGQVLVLLGNGKGTFTQLGKPINAGASAGTLAAGDLNGDGFPDLVVTNKSGSNVDLTVLINQQGAQFTAIQPYPQNQHLLSGSSAALTSLVISNVNGGLFPAIVVGLGGAVNNLVVIQSLGGGQFALPHFYATGGGGIKAGPSYVSLSSDPFVRATTFSVATTQVQGNLTANGTFDTPDLSRESGNLTGWQTFAESGSNGQWTGQTNSLSPLSEISVPSPPQGQYAAMLDEADLALPGSQHARDYQGMHILYQDITIPASVTKATLSFSLFINNSDKLNKIGYTDPLQTSALDYFPNKLPQTANQQVRVDLMDPQASITDVGGGVFSNLFITSPTTARNFGSYRSFSFDVTGFAGRTIRLRFASVNNLGKLIVGLDNVQLQALFNDTTPPAVMSLRLRNPGSGATPSFGGNTTDPTILGQVADLFGVNNVAYVQFDLQNSGTAFSSGLRTYRINDFDGVGNFETTLPLTLPGIYTVGVTVVSRGGNTSRSTLMFNYQGPSLTNWQAVGPAAIQYVNQGVEYKTVSGDITSVALDPRDPSGNVIYVGTDNGGVWKSTDGGADWTPLTDYVTDSNGGPIPIAIGGVAVDPGNPNTVYAATGVASNETASQPGVGILKSTDGGLTWTLVGASVFAGSQASKIAVSKPGRDGLTSIYVAVASGGQFGPGVYRSQDGGSTWTNVLNPAAMFLENGNSLGTGHSLASVTDLVLDQLSDFEENIWVCLGNVGLVGNSDTAGLWKSPDRGNTWFEVSGPRGAPVAELPSASDYPNGGGMNVGRVVFALAQSKPQDNLTMYVLVSTPPAQNGSFADSGQKSEVDMGLADSFGLYKSSDGGLSWTHVMLRENISNLTSTNPRQWLNLFTLGHEGSDVGALAVDPNNRNVVYVGGSTRYLMNNDQMEPPRAHGFIRVDTGNMDPITGDDLTKEGDAAANMGNYPGMGAPMYMGEGVFWYDLQTTDAGQQNTNPSFVGHNFLPATIHTLVFDPLGRLLIGTEGGLFRGVNRGWTYDTTDGGAGSDTQANLMPPMQLSSIETAGGVSTPNELGMIFTDLNSNLQIADTTSIAIDPYNRQTLDSSQESTGFARTTGSLEWSTTNDPTKVDGFATEGPFAGAIRTGPADPTAPLGTPSTVYRIFGGIIMVSHLNGDPGTFQFAVAGINSAAQSPFPPLTVNPQKLLDPNGVFQDEIMFGTNTAFETDNSAASWDQVSPNLNDVISAMAFGPGQDVFYVGTLGGQVFVDLHGGGDGFPNRSGGLPGAAINGIAVDPLDPNIAFVMVGGFGGHVFRTFNAGQRWTNVSNGLPNFPAYSMVIDPRSQPGAPNGRIYVGTQVGVYVSNDEGGSWTRLGNGMPNVPVMDLQFSQNYEEIVAGTLGRGAFVISTQFTGPTVMSAAPNTPASPGLSAITVTFDHPVDPRTFTPSSIQTLTGPGGPIGVLAVNDMDPINHQTYQILFPAQILDGLYNLTIAPSVQDFLGNASGSFSAHFVVNSTDNGHFLTGLYHDLLSRQADTDGFLGSDSGLETLRSSFLQPTALNFVTSDEARADTIYNGAITAQHPAATGYYATLLGRAASPGEVAVWLQDLKQGATPEQVLAAIVSSLEFFQVTGGNDALFVSALYTNPSILGRSTAPSSAEESGWLSLLSGAELTARSSIVNAIVHSDEYRTLLINTFYSKYLGRPASSTDRAVWLPQLQTGLTDEAFLAALLGSDEYFANHGSSNASWLDGVFNDLFGRLPDPAGQSSLLGQLQAGVSRTSVAQQLVTSTEYRTDLIQTDFTTYLGRAATAADVTSFLGALQSGLSDEGILVTVVSSSEYFADKAGTATTLSANDVNWVNAVYQDLLARPADSGGSGNFLQALSLAESTARGGVVQAFVNSAEYRAHLVTATYETYLLRAPNGQEINSWMPLLSQPSAGPGQPNADEIFTSAVLGSSEYFFGPQQRGSDGLAGNAPWLTTLYNRLLGRAPDSAGLDSSLNSTLNSYQTQRLALATNFDTSTEYQTVLVATLFSTYLRRSPSAAETSARVAQLAAGTTDEQLISTLVSSQEYYQNPKLGNSDNSTWLNQAYRDILGRNRDTAGSQSFLNGLNNGSLTRSQVADALLSSTEYRQRLISQFFGSYLGRTPAAAEVNNYLSAIAAGATDEQLIAQILASNEYFERAHTFP